MDRDKAIALIESMEGMSFLELDELGQKISLSGLNDRTKKILFKTIAEYKVERLAEEDREGCEVVCAEIEPDDD